MSTTSSGRPFVFSLFLSLAGLAACSAGTTDGSGGSGGTVANGSSTTSSGGPGSGGMGGGFGTGSGGSCAVHCSADLHQVLDCNDVVVTTCPDDMGCGPAGSCIAPCDSAKANSSTIGCDFFAVTPAPEYQTEGSCFAALLANTWKTPITITADYAGQSLNIGGLARRPMGSGASLTYQPLTGGQLGPGEVAVLFLAQAPGGGGHFLPCPSGVTPGINADTSLKTPGIGHAFHIATSAPVVAYDIYPYGGAQSYVSSATLLVPTPAWGENYVAADAYEEDPAIAFDGGKPFVQIVAATDGTQVTLSPSAAITAGPGVMATPKGQPVTYTLQRGEVLQFLQDAELAGTPITSTAPTSVWGGSGCMNIPVSHYACDSGHQEILPVKALGHEYAAVRYRSRVANDDETVPWTLVGAVDGTALTYEPSTPPGAPTTLSSGQLVRFSSPGPFVVKSQDDAHPFYFAGHMSGWTNLPGGSSAGDAEYVNVVPPQQYLNHYLFLTDPTYGNTNLVFVRKKDKNGTFQDVTLDCAGVLSGWQPMGAGDYEYTRFDLAVNGGGNGNCNNGVHSADSPAPFGLTVWGWDFAVSYAYPAGMSTQPINTVVVPPIPK